MTEEGAGSRVGTVYLVGGGPGDPGLITLRAKELIERADAIVYDSSSSRLLLPPKARESGRPELYDVRRRAIGRKIRPEQVSELLTRLARDGKDVVRLTAGDPLVFGRGGEEAQALNDAFVPFEIVPGITADAAVAAYAGIPVTQRGISELVTYVSGREIKGKGATPTNWAAIANTGGTLMISRGVRRLGDIAAALIDGGMPAEMPAIVVDRVAGPDQRVVHGTIATIAEKAASAAVSPSSSVVIGWTVILRDETAWFEKRPLFGNTVIVSYASHQSAVMSQRLRELGAHVIELPQPEIARLDLSSLRGELGRLNEYQWLLFTSRESVVIFWEQLLGSGRDARSLAGTRVAAVGPEAAAALLERGIAVDVIPARFAVESLLEKLAERNDVTDSNVLLLTPEAPDDTIANELRGLGADVTTVEMYRSIPNERAMRRVFRRLERGTPAAVVFTSAASVETYLQAMGEAGLGIRAASMNSVVTAAVTDAGMELLCEAEEPSTDGLALAMERALT
jgi:uroporphyrinogen III methyltransferase/synthase